MAEPGIREVGCCIWVAALAGLEHILLESNTLGWVIYPLNIMHTVTVVAYGLVGGSLRIDFLEERDSGTMKIGHVGVQHLGRDAILLHFLLIGVALAAYLGGRIDAETGRIGTLDGMHTMAVCAGRDIRIFIVNNAAAVNTVQVLIVNIIMSARADFSDCGVFAGSRVTTGILLNRRLGVSIVAVRADRCIAVT